VVTKVELTSRSPTGWQNQGMQPPKNPKPAPEPRSAYRVLRPITTRWMDNDAYGHVNNVVIETQCNYFAPLAFPQMVHAGIRVAHIGSSSVRYEVGIFGAEENCAAKGHFVHVYVDAATRRPTTLPEKLKTVLETLQ